MDRIGAMSCFGCGASEVTLHHVMRCPGKQRRRDHRFVLPVCPGCHQGREGIHGLGSEAAFEKFRGLSSIAEWAMAQWALSVELERIAA